MSLAIDKAIFKIVTTDAAVSALVSTRMYPGRAPQSARVKIGSFLEYTFSGGTYEHYLGGRTGDIIRDLVVLGACSSESGRMQLSQAIVNALDPIDGPWPATITSAGESVVLKQCFLKDDSEVFLEPGVLEDGGEELAYTFSQTFVLAYTP